MAFYLKLDVDNTIELSTDLNVEERKELCMEIIEKYPQYFEQSLPKASNQKSNASERVCVRLDIMSTYILNAVPISEDGEYKRLTHYKEKRNANSEIPLSAFEYNDN